MTKVQFDKEVYVVNEHLKALVLRVGVEPTSALYAALQLAGSAITLACCHLDEFNEEAETLCEKGLDL